MKERQKRKERLQNKTKIKENKIIYFSFVLFCQEKKNV